MEENDPAARKLRSSLSAWKLKNWNEEEGTGGQDSERAIDARVFARRRAQQSLEESISSYRYFPSFRRCKKTRGERNSVTHFAR